MLALAILLAAADPTRVLVLDLANSGVSADEARVVVTAIAEAAAGPDTQVMTSADLRALSTIAAEQQECGVDATNCLAELAGALDVQRVIHGSISRIDEDLLVQLRSFDARNAASSERVSWRARSIGGVLDAAPTHVAVLLGAEPPPPAPAGLSPLWGGVALGAGALAAGGTAIAGALYNGTLTAPEASRAQKDEALGVGRVVVAAGALVGIALGVTGGVLLAVADWE